MGGPQSVRKTLYKRKSKTLHSFDRGLAMYYGMFANTNIFSLVKLACLISIIWFFRRSFVFLSSSEPRVHHRLSLLWNEQMSGVFFSFNFRFTHCISSILPQSLFRHRLSFIFGMIIFVCLMLILITNLMAGQSLPEDNLRPVRVHLPVGKWWTPSLIWLLIYHYFRKLTVILLTQIMYSPSFSICLVCSFKVRDNFCC